MATSARRKMTTAAQRGGPGPGPIEVLRRTLSYLRPYRPRAVLILLAVIVEVAFNMTFIVGVKTLVDNAVTLRSGSFLGLVLGGLALFFVVMAIVSVSRDYLVASVGTAALN